VGYTHYTPREAPWWVYTTGVHPERHPGGYICSSVHPGRLPWWVYALLYTQGGYPGGYIPGREACRVYNGVYTREGGMQGVYHGVYPGKGSMQGVYQGVYPGCIKVVTRRREPASPIPVSLLGSSRPPTLFPLHCWAVLQSPLLLRFTVGQCSSLLPSPVSLLGKKEGPGRDTRLPTMVPRRVLHPCICPLPGVIYVWIMRVMRLVVHTVPLPDLHVHRPC